jgi:hypothetical protein
MNESCQARYTTFAESSMCVSMMCSECASAKRTNSRSMEPATVDDYEKMRESLVTNSEVLDQIQHSQGMMIKGHILTHHDPLFPHQQ